MKLKYSEVIPIRQNADKFLGTGMYGPDSSSLITSGVFPCYDTEKIQAALSFKYFIPSKAFKNKVLNPGELEIVLVLTLEDRTGIIDFNTMTRSTNLGGLDYIIVHLDGENYRLNEYETVQGALPETKQYFFFIPQKLLDEVANAKQCSIRVKCAMDSFENDINGFTIYAKLFSRLEHQWDEVFDLEFRSGDCTYMQVCLKDSSAISEYRSFVKQANKEIEEKKEKEKQELEAQKAASNTASSSGCYIATCVYGSYDCPEVWTLRRYRDNVLDGSWFGRLFIKAYYAISPHLVRWFGPTQWFHKTWRKRLDRLITKLRSLGFEDSPYIDKY